MGPAKRELGAAEGPGTRAVGRRCRSLRQPGVAGVLDCRWAIAAWSLVGMLETSLATVFGVSSSRRAISAFGVSCAIRVEQFVLATRQLQECLARPARTDSKQLTYGAALRQRARWAIATASSATSAPSSAHPAMSASMGVTVPPPRRGRAPGGRPARAGGPGRRGRPSWRPAAPRRSGRGAPRLA